MGGTPNQQQGVDELRRSVSGVGREERQNLQTKEERFYEEHPQNTLELNATGETTRFGMPVYIDQFGEKHSESSATNQLPDGRWVTYGKIWPDPETGRGRYFTDEEAMDLIIRNNFINPISQEEIPIFREKEEAIKWAVDRDLLLNNPDLMPR